MFCLPQRNIATVVSTVVTGVTLTAAGYVVYRRWMKTNSSLKLPEKWVAVGKVSSLALYPVKSGAGVELQEAECTLLGLKSGDLRDRVFVVVNKKNVIQSPIQKPKMLHISANLHDGVLTLNAPRMESISLNVTEQTENVKCKIWDRELEVHDLGAEVSSWLSMYLYGESEGARLLYYPHSLPHRVGQQGSSYLDLPMAKEDDGAVFQKLSSYMLMSEGSLYDVNTKMSKKVGTRNFRPNIVVKGCLPFAEEGWRFIRIGDVVFRNVRPCTRCPITTIDQDTLGRYENSEPLHTLERDYQCQDPKMKPFCGKKGVMGVHLCVDTPGYVRLGDTVYTEDE